MTDALTEARTQADVIDAIESHAEELAALVAELSFFGMVPAQVMDVINEELVAAGVAARFEVLK